MNRAILLSVSPALPLKDYDGYNENRLVYNP
jgi:hypothetical protein